MQKNETTSMAILKLVLEPHLLLAKDMMTNVRSNRPDDQDDRFESIALGVFLAGIDKALNIAFELLYISGKVEWNWMVNNKNYAPPAGLLMCQRGLMAKIVKLKDLGVDISALQWLVELRNHFFHDSSIYIGFSLSINETDDSIYLSPSGPSISYSQLGMSGINQNTLEIYSKSFIEVVSSFLDENDWIKSWHEISEKLSCLPKNPEPYYSKILDAPGLNLELIEILNREYIGTGAKKLLESK